MPEVQNPALEALHGQIAAVAEPDDDQRQQHIVEALSAREGWFTTVQGKRASGASEEFARDSRAHACASCRAGAETGAGKPESCRRAMR